MSSTTAYSIALLLTLLLSLTTAGEARCEHVVTSEQLIEYSYRKHVHYIQAGISEYVVQQYYNWALVLACQTDCVCSPTTIEAHCFENNFVKNLGNITLDFWLLVENDWGEDDHLKLFPHRWQLEQVPDQINELQQLLCHSLKSQTVHNLNNALHQAYQNGSSIEMSTTIAKLPSDDVMRWTTDIDGACIQLNERANNHSLTLSSETLTAFILGVANQMVQSAGKGYVIENILREHVELVFTSARCHRNLDGPLQIPTVYLKQVTTSAHLVISNSTASNLGTILASMPQLTDMKAIIRLSNRYFAELIDRISGLGSGGITKLVTWTGVDVIKESFQDVLLRNLSLSEIGPLSSEQEIVDGGAHNKSCPDGFIWTDRLDQVVTDGAKCCSQGCLRSHGDVFDVFVLNEMCCRACNSDACDVVQLGNVQRVLTNWANSVSRTT